MNKRILIFMLATLVSHIVKGNLVSHSALGPSCDASIGPNAFAAATAVLLASLASLSNDNEDSSAIFLFTYYTAMTILVSILAIKLLWNPVVDLVSEINTVLSKTILYIHRTVLQDIPMIRDIGLFLGTKSAVKWSTNILGVMFLYAVSTDILHFMEIYIYNLPRKGLFAQLRSCALKLINHIFSIVNTRKYVRFKCKPDVRYYSVNQENTSHTKVFHDDYACVY